MACRQGESVGSAQRRGSRHGVIACLVLLLCGGYPGSRAGPSASEVHARCGEGEVGLFVMSPDDSPGAPIVELELHGLELVRIDVEVAVCNFEALDGSIAVFGSSGEAKLMEVWRPQNGRLNISVELPFPRSDGLDETFEMLESGRAVQYTVEFSLMDSGFEIGATSSLNLALVSAHVPRDASLDLRVVHEKPFVYLLSTKAQVTRPDLETESSDLLQLIWGPVAPTLSNAVWAPGCTWNEARNRLLQEVRARGRHYIYLIFTDDDASLSLRPASVPVGYVTESLDDPWREFERLLLKWQPAAGYARYTIQQPQVVKGEEPEVECVRFADPLLVAYHFEAAAFVLPYTTAFDTESWWYSAVVANALQSLHFRGHVLQFNTLYVHDNQKSVGYAGFRQMNWERPLRWLIAAVGPLDHFGQLGLKNPIQVKCDPGTGVFARTRPYIVGAGDFDVCHPVFAHLRRPERLSSVLLVLLC